MVSRSGSLYEEYFNTYLCERCGHIDQNIKIKACPNCDAHSYKILDGIRQLEWEMDGSKFRSVINIDAQSKRMTAFLYKDGNPLNDKLDEYDGLIEDYLGSFLIFRKSIFSGQQEESLSQLTKGPLKKFFSQLVDVDRYENIYRPSNKQKLDEVDRVIEKDRVRIEEIEKQVSEEAEVTQELKYAEEHSCQIRETITNYNKDIETYKTNLQQIERKERESREAQQRLVKIREEGLNKKKEIERIETDGRITKDLKIVKITELTEKIYTLRSFHIPSVDKKIKEQQEILNDSEKINTNYDRLKELEELINRAYEISQTNTGIERELESEKNKYNIEKEWLKKDTANIVDKINELATRDDLSKTVPCTAKLYDKCALFLRATDEEERKKLQSELERLKDKKISDSKIKRLIKQLKKQLMDVETPGIHSLREEKKILEDEKWMGRFAQLQMGEKQIIEFRQVLKDKTNLIQETEQRITELKEEIESFEKSSRDKIKQLNKEIVDLREEYRLKEALINDELINQVENTKIALTDLENKRSLQLAEKGRVENQIEIYIKNLEKIKLLKEQLEAIQISVGSSIKEIEERKLIDMFLKELPVWELENLSPIIMQYVNDLLSEFYDSAWTLGIDTLTPKARGDGYKEDFKIVVYKDGYPRDFDKLSVGQKNMAESTLRQAIKLVSQELNERNILTAFCDESDGSFDAENADTYYSMLESVHNKGGIYHTFIITHRQELISRIDQKIKLKPNN